MKLSEFPEIRDLLLELQSLIGVDDFEAKVRLTKLFDVEVSASKPMEAVKPGKKATVMKVGKYRGWKLSKVAEKDPKYLQWVLDTDSFTEATKEAVRKALAKAAKKARSSNRPVTLTYESRTPFAGTLDPARTDKAPWED